VIELPEDYAVDNNGRVDVSVLSLYKCNGLPKDIGVETVGKYTDIVKEYDVICVRGPAGVIEEEEFALGTKEILKSITNSNKHLILCGGHLASVLKSLEIPKDRCYISTGGGAALEFIARGTLAGIEALKVSKKIFGDMISQA